MGNHQSQPQNTPEKRSQLQHPAQLSIIIPALNEQNCISQAILSTKVGGAVTQPEVIVVDGGSKDCTRTVAASHAGVQVLSVPEGGRGLQLNKGAEHTRKDWVLFMHADCKLPKGYFESMRTALDDGGSSGEPREWGCFCTLDTGVPSMKLVQWGIRMRTYIRGQPYGDQGLFCSSRAFQCHVPHTCCTSWYAACPRQSPQSAESCANLDCVTLPHLTSMPTSICQIMTACSVFCIHGGLTDAICMGDIGTPSPSTVTGLKQETKFQRWPFLEDLQWVARMNRLHGRPAIADKPIQASPRRWLHYGILQTTCLNQLVLAGYSLGIPVQTLHWFYNSARSQYTSK